MGRKRRWLTVAIILLSLVTLVGAVYLFFQHKSPKEEKNIVVDITKQQAREAAQDNLQLFESWREPKLVEGYTFYDLDGNPSAYLFNVIDNYGKAGFIVISGTTRFEPVIDFSTSPDTPITRIFNLTQKLAEGTIFKPSDIRSEPLFLGGKDYYVKTSYREGDEVTTRFFNLDSSTPQESEINLDVLKEKFQYYLTSQEKNAKAAWQGYFQ